MLKFAAPMILVASLAGSAQAQDYYAGNGAGTYAYDAGGYPYGAASIGSSEQLFPYDDQEPWKHGWRQVMPYYGGWHSFRPYNYHHVFGQTQAAAAYGMPLPYSQQFWHRYQALPGENVVPFPQPAVGPNQLWSPPPTAGMMMSPGGMEPSPALIPNGR